MPIRETVTADDAVALMNEALQLDPVGFSDLVGARVPCNTALGDHPTIQCGASEDRTECTVGLLGVINGLFGVADDHHGAIAAIANDDGDIEAFVRHRIAPEKPRGPVRYVKTVEEIQALPDDDWAAVSVELLRGLIAQRQAEVTP